MNRLWECWFVALLASGGGYRVWQIIFHVSIETVSEKIQSGKEKFSSRASIMAMAKKKQPKTKVPRPLARTSGELRFWVHEGPVLESIADLKRALKEMRSEQFEHHTRIGNDFSAWLADVLRHARCAKAVARATTQQGMLRALTACTD